MDHLEFARRGGKARAEKLSANQRSEIARLAAFARWKFHVKKQASKQTKPDNERNQLNNATTTRQRRRRAKRSVG